MSKHSLSEIRNIRHLELTRVREQSPGLSLPFSLDIAGYVGGVRIVNDSAATNLIRLAESLESFSKPVVWIGEANDYLDDLSRMIPLMSEKVRVAIAKGPKADEAHRMLAGWPGMVLTADSWEEALDLALICASVHEDILFSPGCRSVEPFANFAERGAYINGLIDIKRNTKIQSP